MKLNKTETRTLSTQHLKNSIHLQPKILRGGVH